MHCRGPLQKEWRGVGTKAKLTSMDLRLLLADQENKMDKIGLRLDKQRENKDSCVHISVRPAPPQSLPDQSLTLK